MFVVQFYHPPSWKLDDVVSINTYEFADRISLGDLEWHPFFTFICCKVSR
jgi:hypothetical protein